MKIVLIYIVSFLFLCAFLSQLEIHIMNKRNQFNYKDADIDDRCIHYQEKILEYKRSYKC